MGLEMVDVFLFTADNISVTTMAREQKHPPVRELGEVDDKYIIGTAEILSFPQKKVWKPKQRNALGIQMNGRKSDTAILSQKSVKTDGEKGCALYSFKNKELCRQKRADEHGE